MHRKTYSKKLVVYVPFSNYTKIMYYDENNASLVIYTIAPGLHNIAPSIAPCLQCRSVAYCTYNLPNLQLYHVLSIKETTFEHGLK